MTYGIEEEVFIVKSGKPSLESLFYLTLLLWRRGYSNYFRTASNFSHMPDLRGGLMGGVEISTEVCCDVDSLLGALVRRRKELAEVSSGLIVPMGHLFNEDAPTKTCGMHVHIGGLADIERAYNNLAHFLPLLALLTANSPCADGKYFGCSYRIHSCPFIGPLKNNPSYRFQDIIISKRLKTLEVRIFDATWDISRIKKLLEIIEVIVRIEKDIDFVPSFYAAARMEAAMSGYGKFTDELFNQLSGFCDISQDLFRLTPSGMLYDYYEKNGLNATLAALDNAYRTGKFEAVGFHEEKPSIAKIGIGIIGYFIPKLPYTVWKACREMGDVPV